MADDILSNSICDDELKVIYKNHKPLGIRDGSGFLFFFSDIQQYQGQEERYRREIEQQFRLADYLLSKLLMVRELTPPTPATEYPPEAIKEGPDNLSVGNTKAGFVNLTAEQLKGNPLRVTLNGVPVEDQSAGIREFARRCTAAPLLTKEEAGKIIDRAFDPHFPKDENELNHAYLLKKYPFLDNTRERKEFEQWYACNAFDYEKNPVGSRECGLQWAAWIARANPPNRVPAAWRSKEQYSPDVGSWYEYYDAFREVNDITGLTPLYE